MTETDQPLDLSTGTRISEADEKQHGVKPKVPASEAKRPYSLTTKPPYTYMGMIAVAIHTSPNRRLTLNQINDSLCDMFLFFKGEYTKWRATVRHVLSHKTCFTAVKRYPEQTKGCYWTVDLSLLPPNALTRAAIKDPHQKRCWAPTLTRQLGISDIDTMSSSQQQTTENQSQLNSLRPDCPISLDDIKISEATKPVLTIQPRDDMTSRQDHIGQMTTAPWNQNHHHRQPAHPIHRSYRYVPNYEVQNSSFAAMLYKSVTTLDVSHTTSSLCPSPWYDEMRPFSTLLSSLQTFPESEPSDQCVCQEYLPLQEPQSGLRLNLEDWSRASMGYNQ